MAKKKKVGSNGEVKISIEPKAGIKTTEMWITAIVAAAAILATFAGKVEGGWGLACAVISAGMYALSRGLAKSK